MVLIFANLILMNGRVGPMFSGPAKEIGFFLGRQSCCCKEQSSDGLASN
jgi:hypothetical protein